MFKSVALLKRRPGMSVDEFRTYYEQKHAPLGLSFMPQARRYLRRYVTAAPHPLTGEAMEPDFDVITEIWCESRRAYDEMLAHLTKPEIAATIIADEEKLFDRSKMQVLLLDECETSIKNV